MYMEPVGPTECFRLAVLDPGVPLYYKDFTNLSGWYIGDTRITATVTNDDVRLHANFGSATPLDNWAIGVAVSTRLAATPPCQGPGRWS